ncbi:kinase-like domain-containing protein [Amylocystis lapponica]|nr:kinase-like domain-containing protein [Amylocystis lapponica]
MKVVNYASGLSHGACRGIVNELKTLQCFASCGDQMSPFVMGPALRVERWAWRSPGGFIHMLSDVAGGGTLMDYRGKLWPETLQLIAAELVLGIQFLHSVGIIHHDLKPDNVLVTSSGHCLITDFGAVKFTNSGRLTRNEHEDVIFTPEFAAPEMLEDADGQEYDGTVDYFSLGAIMGAMVVVLGDHDVCITIECLCIALLTLDVRCYLTERTQTLRQMS